MYATFRQPLTQKPRVICFPPAGAGAGVYRDWVGRVPGLDVVAARLPGRGDRFAEDPMTAFTPLVQHLLDGITPFIGVPLTLFGHSMGALLAYEVGRRLEAQGRPPAMVVAAGMSSPRTWMLPAGLGTGDDEVLAGLVDGDRDTESALANPELRDLVLPILRADLGVLTDYRYDESFPPLGAPTRVYYGIDEVSEPVRLERDWREAVRGDLLVRGFPGGHFFIRSARDAVIEQLAQDLAGVMAPR